MQCQPYWGFNPGHTGSERPSGKEHKTVKLLIALLLVSLLLVNLYNCWQVQQLQLQVAVLQSRVQKAETAGNATSDVSTLLEKAVPLLAQARDAVQKADYTKARKLLGQAGEQANQLSHTLGSKSGPAADWLRDQVRRMQEQMDTPHH